MPYTEVNGAEIYYETFGEEKPGRAPIVLIHGSTGTGRSNWSLVAPLLAREYFVIVPDCRGHGMSSNPNRSYSFKEMAADTAALVRALGYERAHIIGHSNGGNVALVVLMEHPEVVQTAIPQAANAWVSPDLVEKEPPLFDPGRVEREAPDWKESMIALHGKKHGENYWRDLLKLTLDELISEPNYTPADLQKVRRPVLVIQGEKDRVNAPYQHVQFIARHIPAAESWIPAEIGHNVHDELLFEWVEKVLDFLKRRGSADNDAIYRLGRSLYADERDWIYDVRAEGGGEAGRSDPVRLSGRVLLEQQRREVVNLFENRNVEDRLQVLLEDSTPWALVNRNVTDLRRSPQRFSERQSQILLGEAVRILEDRGEWALVRLEEDGYIGWVKTAALYRCEKGEVDSYQASGNALVRAGLAQAYTGPDSAAQAGLLPFGVLVPVVDMQGGMAAVCLPDGRRWWVKQDDLLPLEQRPKPDREGFERTLELLKGFTGVPYLWGGRTPFGFDCSGLAQAFLRFTGLKPRRDAGQQMQQGRVVEGEFQPGDLLFFGTVVEFLVPPGEPPDRSTDIYHVAISLGGDEFIHSTGSTDSVTFNSLNPESPPSYAPYSPSLKTDLVGARRYP